MTTPPDPACRFCAKPMRGRRRHAVYCGNACRADASRLRRLLDGQAIDGYESVLAFLMTRRTRSAATKGPSNASDGRKRPREAITHPTRRDDDSGADA